MNNNSFNTCSRCGSANSLSAKYCYQCGARLKVPDEPKACPKCGTINSGLSNYCRACGSALQGNVQVKYCPQCHKELPVGQTVCDCGYSFVAPTNAKRGKVQNTAGVPAANAAATDSAEVAAPKRSGGRGIAFLSIILILVFYYLLFAPAAIRWDTLTNVLSMYVVDGAASNTNGMDVITNLVQTIMETKAFPTDAHTITLVAMESVMSLTIGLQFLCALIRLIAGIRPRMKRSNILYLILFLLTGICSALLYCSTIPALSKFLGIFAPAAGSMGFLIFLIPAYYFIFWLMSFGTKVRVPKEK